MSDTGIIAIVVGVVVIVLLALYRGRLTNIAVDGRKRQVDLAMHPPPPTHRTGARQEDVDADRNVLANDKTGVGASQKHVRSGRDVSAIVESPPGQSAAKKG